MNSIPEVMLLNATKNANGTPSNPVEVMGLNDTGTLSLACWHSSGVSVKGGRPFDSFTLGRLAFNTTYQAWGLAGYGFGQALNIPWQMRGAFLLSMVRLAVTQGVISGFTLPSGTKVTHMAVPKPAAAAPVKPPVQVVKAPAKRARKTKTK